MRRRLVIALGALLALGAIAWGVSAWRYSVHHVWTDDAYVEGIVSPVSAKVSGHVLELLVGDHQPVRAGDLLLRVDSRDYAARRDQARAAVAVAEATVRAARSEVPMAREGTRAQIDQGQAALQSAQAAVRAAEAAVEEARARLEARRAAANALRAEAAGAASGHRQAKRELERVRQLLRGEYVAQRDYDQAEAAAETTGAAAEAAERRLTQAAREIEQGEAEVTARRHAVEQARQRVGEVRAALAAAESQAHTVPIKQAEVSRAEAALQQARADLAVAELQLAHTEVRAPTDGVVAKRGVEVGQIVQPGQPLLAIVPLHQLWVVANFKETQLTRVRPGLAAEVRVDTFPGRTFRGVVDSISAGTGARFSLLPPENATGNWVKVVQRVPVKILLEGPTGGNPHTLRAGLSAVVTIRVE